MSVFKDLLQAGQPVASTDLGIQEAVLVSIADLRSGEFFNKIEALERELRAAGRQVCVVWIPSENCVVGRCHACTNIDHTFHILTLQISENDYEKFVTSHRTWLTYPFATLLASSRALRARIPTLLEGDTLAVCDGSGQFYLQRSSPTLANLSVNTFPWRDAAAPQGLEPKWAQLGAIIGLFAVWVAIGASVL